MNKELQRKYFEYYFKQYFVPVDKNTLENYSQKFSQDFNVFYLYGNRKELLRVGFCFLAHNHNYKDCFKMMGYDLVEFFLDHMNEIQNSQTFYDIPEKNLIIHHLAGTTSNVKLVSLIKHVMSFRAVAQQKTLILTEEDIWNEIQDGQTAICKLKENTEDLISDI